MSKYKQGATIRVLLSEMSDTEWALFDTADQIRSEARVATRDGSADVQMNVAIDRVNKTVEITHLADNTMPVGNYLMDIAITKNGETIFIPVDSYFTFSVINAITGAYI
jgi:hypothetical protein